MNLCTILLQSWHEAGAPGHSLSWSLSPLLARCLYLHVWPAQGGQAPVSLSPAPSSAAGHIILSRCTPVTPVGESNLDISTSHARGRPWKLQTC